MFKSNYDYVFCDSFEALNLAYKKGLDQKIKVKTCSPWMNFNKRSNYINMDEKMMGKKLVELRDTIFPFTLKIHKTLVNYNFDNESIIAAITGIELTKFIRKAACLDSQDIQKRVLILKVKTKDKIINQFANTNWEVLLDPKNITLKTIEVSHPYEKLFKETNYTYLQMLNIYNSRSIYFFLLKRLKFLLNLKKSKKVVFVYREDHLVREIVLYLFKNGVIPIFCDYSKLKKLKFCKQKFGLLKKKLEPVISRYIVKWVPVPYREKLLSFFFLMLKKQLDKKESARYFFDDFLSNFNQEILCMSSFPAKAETIGLYQSIKTKKLKFVSTQHGVNREINFTCDEGMSTWENGVSDLLFVNNNESKSISESSPFAKGKCHVVGTAKQLYTKKTLDLRFGKKEIYFISTRVYSTNRMMPGGYLTDIQKADQEIQIVKKVFKKVSKKIIFKTYPDIPLYVDKDPVFEEVKKAQNLFLLATSKDIQYYFKRMSLIITSRATSTLSICLLSKIPIIFINYPDQSMLKKELIKKFNQSLFFFDFSDKHFFFKLRSFLDKPENIILKEWKEKKIARENFVNNYFSKNSKVNAGEMASNFLIKNSYFRKIVK